MTGRPAADFPAKPTPTGATVVPRPFAEEDAPTMAAILRDPEVLLPTGSAGAPPVPDERLRSWYAGRRTGRTRPDTP
ncbi:GNAT family N-acetyltransferase [Streptomyces spongiicola]|uniref:hypothetical protein n=1 Tax=Streptomyces spongiicola TaxID=1690221 RepID=UPI00157FB679|nr:hypothetical protein [Streptomyces spongiicola]